MATYLWADLADGQSIAFDPDADLLDFSGAATAAEVRLRAVGPDSTSFTLGDKTVTLNGLALQEIDTADLFDDFENVRFASGDLAIDDDTGRTFFRGDTDDQLLGFGGNDRLVGGRGDDVLDGGAGNDELDGISVPDGSDTASYGSAISGVTVSLATSAAQDTGGAGTDTLRDIENLVGSAFNDLLTGSGEDNVIEGGAGDDTMAGGLGVDTADYRYAAGGVSVDLGSTLAQDTGGDGTDTLSGFENLRGSKHDDVLTGDAADNVVTGGAGDDDLDGGEGNDTAVYAGAAAGLTADLAAGGASGGAGSDTLAGFENLTGSSHDDTLGGDAGNNVLRGGGGDDVLEGRGGDDILDGDAGFDSVSYAGAAGDVTVDLGIAIAQNVGLDAGWDTLIGIEEVVGSAHDDSLTGDAADNILDGGQGNDILDGGDGRDLVTYLRPTTTSGVTVSLAEAEAQSTGGAGTDTLSNIELLAGSTFADTLTGSSLANDLFGDAGNDTIAGGDGDDLLEGGADNDALGGGNGDDVVNGGSGDDTLGGDSGNDTLDGGAGNDTLNGGDGVDRVSYAAFATKVTVSLATTAGQNTGGAGSDTLVGIENLTGGSGNDKLTGNTAANRLEGGGGTDTLIGGKGNDTYVVEVAQDVVTEAADAGTDLVQSTASQYVLSSNVEKLTLLGSDGIRGTGNALNNVLTGNNGDNVLAGAGGNDTIVGGAGVDRLEGGAGNDILDGGAGSDVMAGGAGRDTYKVDVNTDVVTETYGEGLDLVLSTAAGYTLKPYVENLMLLGSANTGVGNIHDNVITGNDADNFLMGEGGNDTLFGNGGDDILSGSHGSDRLFGGPGNDFYYAVTGSKVIEEANEGTDLVESQGVNYTLPQHVENLTITNYGAANGTGNGVANVLTGSYGVNRLNGAGGDDVLIGRENADTLVGGGGADRFDFDSVSESGPFLYDKIVDFDKSEGDRIDLSTIDANPLTAGLDDAFHFIGADSFSNVDATGELRFDAATRLLLGSTNADPFAEFSILLSGVGINGLGVDAFIL